MLFSVFVFLLSAGVALPAIVNAQYDVGASVSPASPSSFADSRVSPFGGKLLLQALREVLDPILETYRSQSAVRQWNSQSRGPGAKGNGGDFSEDWNWEGAKDGDHIGENYKSSLHRRCSNFLACEHHIPVVEVRNAIFYKGALYLNNPSADTLNHIRNISQIFASRKNHLPVSLAHVQVNGGEASTWVTGPRIVIFDSRVTDGSYVPPAGFKGPSSEGDGRPPVSCSRVWDTGASFLFPWEVGNAYHTMHDNVLSALASVVLQYVTDATHRARGSGEKGGNGAGGAASGPPHRTLFAFKGQPGSEKAAAGNALYRLLHVLFDGDVQPASALLASTAGAQCVRRVVWGSAAKPFYADGLGQLRRVLYTVLRRVLQLRYGEKLVPPRRENLLLGGHLALEASSAELAYARDARVERGGAASSRGRASIKVVLVSRNLDGSQSKPARSLQEASERALLGAFQRQVGVHAERCCRFGDIRTPQALLAIFADADVCIGVHGAGLTNCLLGPPGVLVFELQARRFPYFGFDSFMKIAHMAGGTYACYIAPSKVSDTGMTLSAEAVDDIVLTALALVSSSESISAGERLQAAPNAAGGSLSAAAGASAMWSLTTHIAPNGTHIVLVPSPHQGPLSDLPALDILGPLGRSKGANRDAWSVDPGQVEGVVPYYSAKGYISPLNYAVECKRLPYYAFRKRAKEMINVESSVPCDQNKIVRKPTTESLTASFEKQIRPYLT